MNPRAGHGDYSLTFGQLIILLLILIVGAVVYVPFIFPIQFFMMKLGIPQDYLWYCVIGFWGFISLSYFIVKKYYFERMKK